MPCPNLSCFNPHDKVNHVNNYHRKSATVSWNSETIVIPRRPDGLLDCPCREPLHRRYSKKIINRLALAQGSDHPPPVCSDVNFLDVLVEKNPEKKKDPPNAASADASLIDAPLMPVPLEEKPNVYYGDESGGSMSTRDDLLLGRVSPMEMMDDNLDPATDTRLEESPSDNDSGGDFPEESCDEDGDTAMEHGDDGESDEADACAEIETEAAAKAVLESSGFVVDPVYRAIICMDCHEVISYKNAYRHRTTAHSAHHKISSRLLGQSRLQSCLTRLQADCPLYPLPGCEPIPRVEYLKVDMFWGCGVPGCSPRRLWSSVTTYHKSHGRVDHLDLPLPQRQPIQVPGHCFCKEKSKAIYVRVIQATVPSTLSSDSPLALVLQHSKASGVGDPHKMLIISDKRELTEVLYHGEWAKILHEVPFEALMASAMIPGKEEPLLLSLRDNIRRYYRAIPPLFSELGQLTKSQIISHTLDYNNFQQFREPQNDKTLNKDADEMTRFLSFILRCMSNPVENFPVHLHPLTRQNLEALSGEISRLPSTNACLKSLIHETIWSFLSLPVPEYLKDDNACPLTRYLIAVHLKTSRGRFSKASFVPPTLSRLQWAFRATGCRQVLNIRAFVAAVQPFLIAGKATLFHSLKGSHAFYTTLAKNEPGYARFSWDFDYKVLSVDGFPVLMSDFADSISGCLEMLHTGIRRLFRGCDYEDILDHISARLDPDNPRMWLQDDPLNSDYGESVITNPVNGFKAFGPNKEDLTMRLLSHLSNSADLFTTKEGIDGKPRLEANRGNVMDWICELNECVKLLFYLVTATWGGGARGTEMMLIQHSNTVNDRHIFVFNGMLTIVTNYSKTQSSQGHGAHSPKNSSSSDLYASHLFVLSGHRADTDLFTDFMREITTTYLGATLGVRSWRQFMHTMLVNLAKVDFTSSDQLDEEVQHVHAMFAHTQQVGQQHYSIQCSNALSDVSATSVSSNQRVSFRWHAVNNLLHPAHQAKAKSEHGVPSMEDDAALFQQQSMYDKVTRAVANQFLASFDKRTNELKRTMEESTQRLMINSMQYTHTRLSSSDNRSPSQQFNKVPIQVHPQLFREIQYVLPSGSIGFQSPQQAELVQSTLGKENILAIMPTGSGKSLSFFAAPCLDVDGLYIVVTPLTALTEDMGRRLGQNHAVRGGIYPKFSSQDGQLIFVAAHHAGTDQFLRWLGPQQSRLRRVFIDECHHIYLSSTYRACFRLFHKLTNLKKPFTFLSSTVLPQSIPLLCNASNNTRAIARPNITYSVRRIPEEEDLMPLSRCLPKGLSWVDADPETNAQRRRWIVGTQCLGEGIDQSNVRIVVHANVTTLIDVVQQTGRGGRDWKEAFSFIFWNQLPWTSKRDGQTSILPDDWDDCYDVVVGPEHYGIDELIIFLQAEFQCRRILLVGPHDGEAHSCAALGGTLCDNCRRVADRVGVLGMCQDPNLEAPLAAAATLSKKGGTLMPIIMRAQQAEGVLPRIEDVNSAGDRVRAHYQESEGHLSKLKDAVNSILGYRCAYCWVHRRPGESESGHEHHVGDLSTRGLLRLFRVIQYDDRDVIHQALSLKLLRMVSHLNAMKKRVVVNGNVIHVMRIEMVATSRRETWQQQQQVRAQVGREENNKRYGVGQSVNMLVSWL
ncbi:hypothetical protein EDD18DRAFT_1108610 [Armillaria luteobubalina]|uniref:Helicase ATP-binding domain-containing protein n=1 Tax=Armillaria luteobubalina TaxID=153913 RepID=A0AA39ULJ5_9AGAR|nr:hypothetical protein EDD18DRAFT_1108610 [Armillaria luteobubalina]